jgi:hypothetical protein
MTTFEHVFVKKLEMLLTFPIITIRVDKFKAVDINGFDRFPQSAQREQ